VQCVSTGKPFLQWLWSAYHNHIASSPLHPCLSLIAEQWKRQLHREFIQSGGISTPPDTLRNRIVSPLDITSEQLSTSLAKLASTFERNSLETLKKDKQQHPNWGRLSIQSQQTILRAMMNNCHSAAAKPTDTYSDFLSQCSAAAAQQYLIGYFEANHRSRNVCINQGMTSALWSRFMLSSFQGRVWERLSLQNLYFPGQPPKSLNILVPNLADCCLALKERQNMFEVILVLIFSPILRDWRLLHHVETQRRKSTQ